MLGIKTLILHIIHPIILPNRIRSSIHVVLSLPYQIHVILQFLPEDFDKRIDAKDIYRLSVIDTLLRCVRQLRRRL